MSVHVKKTHTHKSSYGSQNEAWEGEFMNGRCYFFHGLKCSRGQGFDPQLNKASRLQDRKTPADAGWASCGGKQSDIDGLTEPNTAVDRAVNLAHLLDHSRLGQRNDTATTYISPSCEYLKLHPGKSCFVGLQTKFRRKIWLRKKIFHVVQRQWDAS